MFDASYALGIMTFNSMGTILVLATWEYIKTRRELGEDQAKTRETVVAPGTRELVPNQG